MNSDNNMPADEADDKAFERKLGKLYRAALFDETFQQQMVQDFALLSDAGKSLLRQPERAFLQDDTLSATAKERLLDLLPPCSPVQTKPETWWQRLFGTKTTVRTTGAPRWSIPVAVMAGLVVGLMLPSFMALLVKRDDVMRGGEPTSTVSPTNPTPTEMTFSPEVKQDPTRWLNGIADLVRQGKISAATAELDDFRLRYPNYH